MHCNDLIAALNYLLRPELFKDYAPNGLQVQGKSDIKKIVTAVTATQTVIDRAAELGADAILVHHGWFWRGENPCIVQTKYRRLKALMDADMSLIAYHLPLDAHLEVGNNALLGRILGAKNCSQVGDGNLLWIGEIDSVTVNDLSLNLSSALKRPALVLGPQDIEVKKVAWCSGAAEDFFEEAIMAGAQAYVSGEAAERSTHLARESGVPYLVCGHHATERLGIQALGKWIEMTMGIETIFIDDDNPI